MTSLNLASPRARTERESGFHVQARVIVALVHRELLPKLGRNVLGYIWAVVSPLITTAIHAVLFAVMQRRAPVGESFVLFFATGYLPYLVFRQMAGKGFGLFTGNASLYAFPAIKPMDVLLSRLFLEYWIMTFSSLICFSLIILAGYGGAPVHTSRVFLAYALVAVFGFDLALINACIETFLSKWDRFFRALILVLFYSTGVFFVPDLLPEQFRVFVAWNPLTHIIELMRTGYYPNYVSQTFDAAYISWWTLGLLPVALSLERAVRMSRSA